MADAMPGLAMGAVDWAAYWEGLLAPTAAPAAPVAPEEPSEAQLRALAALADGEFSAVRGEMRRRLQRLGFLDDRFSFTPRGGEALLRTLAPGRGLRGNLPVLALGTPFYVVGPGRSAVRELRITLRVPVTVRSGWSLRTTALCYAADTGHAFIDQRHEASAAEVQLWTHGVGGLGGPRIAARTADGLPAAQPRGLARVFLSRAVAEACARTRCRPARP